MCVVYFLFCCLGVRVSGFRSRVQGLGVGVDRPRARLHPPRVTFPVIAPPWVLASYYCYSSIFFVTFVGRGVGVDRPRLRFPIVPGEGQQWETLA